MGRPRKSVAPVDTGRTDTTPDAEPVVTNWLPRIAAVSRQSALDGDDELHASLEDIIIAAHELRTSLQDVNDFPESLDSLLEPMRQLLDA